MARYTKEDAGRPGGGNGKNNEGWGKGATDGSLDGDHLQGQHGVEDVIDGLGGDDNINGFSGDDILTGGDGADDITPGQGEDIVDLRVVTDDGGTPEDASDDTYAGDEDNDTVNIGVDDDQPEGTSDLSDTILGYEVAVPGAETGTFETKDVIELGGIGDSINHFVEGGTGTGSASADGDIVGFISAAELEQFLWVDGGQLIFDADGNVDLDATDDDMLALIMDPAGEVAEDGVTVRFQGEVEVVTDYAAGETAVQSADYVAVWNNNEWSISVDGDWMVA